ncbi:MAG: hypothetical protein AAF517_13085 [Planctomycetota bacterium]
MSQSPFGLLELGSNSLKFYRVRMKPGLGYDVSTFKFPWSVSHEVFSGDPVADSEIPESVIGEVVSKVLGVRDIDPELPLETVLTVATGVFREFSDLSPLEDRLRAESKVRLRVISGEDEATLMARDFFARDSEPKLLCDLGGATTEWASIIKRKPVACGSVRLGAIRNKYAVPVSPEDPKAFVARSRSYCDGHLRELPVAEGEVGVELLVIGGTAKALAKTIGSDEIPAEALTELIDRVVVDGPPEDLKPQRKPVFLPGLVVLERLAEHCGAPKLFYAKTSVRHGMAARLVKLLQSHDRDDLHTTLLLGD